ncbi:MAG: sugar ABC transporter permease [Oscillospiraceae bacterium]|nr:sugar ABC transporter permease [Oscillospiraceae bacterium]
MRCRTIPVRLRLPKAKSPRKRLHKKPLTFLFLIPSLIGVLLFFVLPFGMVIYYSLVNRPVGGECVGLDNFKALLDNKAFLLGAKNTGILLAVSVPLAVLLPLKLALWLERAIPMKSQLRTAFLSPMLVPIASVILVWQVLFHQNGTLNAYLGSHIDWFHSPWSILMVLLLYLWKNIGYHTILFTAALAAIPRTYIDMANLDGASRTKQFFKVKLPFLAPTIFFVVLMSLIASMKIFREVWLLTGSYPYESLYLLQHFMNNTFRTMDYQKLSAAALMLAVIMGALIAVLLRVESCLDRDTENE